MGSSLLPGFGIPGLDNGDYEFDASLDINENVNNVANMLGLIYKAIVISGENDEKFNVFIQIRDACLSFVLSLTTLLTVSNNINNNILKIVDSQNSIVNGVGSLIDKFIILNSSVDSLNNKIDLLSTSIDDMNTKIENIDNSLTLQNSDILNIRQNLNEIHGVIVKKNPKNKKKKKKSKNKKKASCDKIIKSLPPTDKEDVKALKVYVVNDLLLTDPNPDPDPPLDIPSFVNREWFEKIDTNFRSFVDNPVTNKYKTLYEKMEILLGLADCLKHWGIEGNSTFMTTDVLYILRNIHQPGLDMDVKFFYPPELENTKNVSKSKN